MPERRCASCGALVAADAEWCGQCYASLEEQSEAGEPRPRGAGSALREGLSPASWRCPTCGEENDLDADACRMCGTPFARLFEVPAPAPSVSPAAAVAWSLLLPGLGHWFAGRRPEAVARFVLAAWIVGMLLVLIAGGGAAASGALAGLFAVAAAALWTESAIDARRAAAGIAPVVSSRAMLWACVALVGLSILLATLLTLPGLRTIGPGAPIK